MLYRSSSARSACARRRIHCVHEVNSESNVGVTTMCGSNISSLLFIEFSGQRLQCVSTRIYYLLFLVKLQCASPWCLQPPMQDLQRAGPGMRTGLNLQYAKCGVYSAFCLNRVLTCTYKAMSWSFMVILLFFLGS